MAAFDSYASWAYYAGMDFAAVISFLTAAMSVGVKVFGLPDQIKSNFQRKSTTGLSTWFVFSAFISYILWTIHGIQVHDNALIIGQGLGVATTGIIVWQVFLYRTNHTKKTKVSKYVYILLTNKISKRVSGHRNPFIKSHKKLA